MAALNRLTGYILYPIAPDRQNVVPFLDETLLAPQHEKRTVYALHAPVCLVQLIVNAGCGAVIFTHGVDRLRVVAGAQIIGERLGMESLASAAEVLYFPPL